MKKDFIHGAHDLPDNWIRKTVEIVEYLGEPSRTRGDYGEEVQTGYLDSRNNIWTWDSTFGWSRWDTFNPSWRKTGTFKVIEGPSF